MVLKDFKCKNCGFVVERVCDSETESLKLYCNACEENSRFDSLCNGGKTYGVCNLALRTVGDEVKITFGGKVGEREIDSHALNAINNSDYQADAVDRIKFKKRGPKPTLRYGKKRKVA